MSLFELTEPAPAATPRRTMGSHERPHHGETDIWLTPPQIVRALGTFDLDPCAAPDPRPWDTAKQHYTLPTNGLFEPWFGRVWLNPPYGAEAARWVGRLAEHGNGIALLFARTETEMFFRSVWGKADAVFFLDGRLRFHRPSGDQAPNGSGAPSCLIAYGAENVEALSRSGLDGCLVKIAQRPQPDSLSALFEDEEFRTPELAALPPRDGRTYCHAFDAARLARQHAIVWDVMKDGEWHYIPDVAKFLKEPEASVGSRVRDFRKARFGAHLVEKRRKPGTDPRSGVWEHRLVINTAALEAV